MRMSSFVQSILYFVSICTGIFLFDRVANSLKDFRAGDIGLGIATTTHENFFSEQPINQTHGGVDQILETIKYFKDQGKEVVLLLGNSQLHSINYYQEGDFLTVYYLNERAVVEGSNLRFVQLSSPNVNFQELLIYYLVLSNQEIRPDWIFIGATFRGFQLSSVREKFIDELSVVDLSKFELSQDIKVNLTSITKNTINDSLPERLSLQKRTEDFIVSKMEDFWEPYRYRGNVRSQLKIIPGLIYQKYYSKKTFFESNEVTEAINMNYLKQLTYLANNDSVRVLLYQPPHPFVSSEVFQYDKVDYKNCYNNIQDLCKELPFAYFASFENVVPLEYWGKNNRGRLDIFHFRVEGHKLLAENLFNHLIKLKTANHAF